METKTESDIKDSRDNRSTSELLLAKDLHQKLDIIYHRASLKLLQLNAGQTHCCTDNITNSLFL